MAVRPVRCCCCCCEAPPPTCRPPLPGGPAPCPTSVIHPSTCPAPHHPTPPNRYLNERLSFGMAPDHISDVMTQRLRWAMGALQILMKDNPMRLVSPPPTPTLLSFLPLAGAHPAPPVCKRQRAVGMAVGLWGLQRGQVVRLEGPTFGPSRRPIATHTALCPRPAGGPHRSSCSSRRQRTTGLHRAPWLWR